MSRLRHRPQPDQVTGTTQRVPVVGAPAQVPAFTRSGPAAPVPRRPALERRVLVVAGALLAGVLAAAVLAGSMSDAMTSRAAALEARAVNDQIAAQVAAGRQEVEFAKTSAFLGIASRSFGYGRSGKERQFALTPGAPRPPAIAPLCGSSVAAPPTDMIRSVLDLLFER
ncbi:MAG: hypothetical protein LH650_09755 [Chloroflexi bacterium]|nr:hypothetical protein [Chloroflexota bacterium]